MPDSAPCCCESKPLSFGLLGELDGEPVGPAPSGSDQALGTVSPEVLAYAQSAADFLGVSLEDLAKDGADALLSFFGFGPKKCSDHIKRKWRKIAADASFEELGVWLRTRQARQPDGQIPREPVCNKYALAQAAARVMRAAQGGTLPSDAAEAAEAPTLVQGMLRRLTEENRRLKAENRELRARFDQARAALAQQKDAEGGLGPALGFILGLATGGVGGYVIGGKD